VLIKILVPYMLAGGSPFIGSLVVAVVVSVITVLLSHGCNTKSLLALIGMNASLLLVVVLAAFSVKAATLLGFGSEEASFLQLGETVRINPQGLLLGGIVLGALGVLDDICIAQTAVVLELKKANTLFTFQQLFKRAMNIGKDHVASLVNTLMLAYAGANMALLVLISIDSTTPLWVRLNSELIAEEVVRTIVGSIGLVLAVPITTFLTALYVQHRSLDSISSSAHEHHSH
ncbi:YibE/F family protein, partial [Candidatus Woesebacteria bacterium]|nr:YibE/F family protein [Candidatus Woesebacteria bacterium]